MDDSRDWRQDLALDDDDATVPDGVVPPSLEDTQVELASVVELGKIRRNHQSRR